MQLLRTWELLDCGLHYEINMTLWRQEVEGYGLSSMCLNINLTRGGIIASVNCQPDKNLQSPGSWVSKQTYGGSSQLGYLRWETYPLWVASLGSWSDTMEEVDLNSISISYSSWSWMSCDQLLQAPITWTSLL